MLRTSELDKASSVTPEDVEDFLDNAAWALCSTHHTVLNLSPGSAIFGQDMMFNIPYIADWTQNRGILTSTIQTQYGPRECPKILIMIMRLADKF